MSSIVSTPPAGGEQPTPLDESLDLVLQAQGEIKAQLHGISASLDKLDALAARRAEGTVR